MRILSGSAIGRTCLILGVACGEPEVRNCVLEQSDPDDGHQLDYKAVMPSDCPVPLGTIGEEKFVGATLFDYGASDYNWVLVKVENSAGVEKGSDMRFFQTYDGPGKRAQPQANYPAATGFSGSIVNGEALPDAAKDKGTFQAVLHTGATGAFAKLVVAYVGTTVQSSISGPDVPLSGANGTWTASASGGSTPYTYAWYRNGELVENSATYSANVGTSEFGLRLIVTDQTTASRWTDYWVDVDGVRASISGPTLIYYSEGNATWTADIRGGYASYIVDWYFENGAGQQTYAGSGTTLTTYPAQQGEYTLFALISDSHGTTTTSTLNVIAIGDGNGGCTPVPPQITCDP